MARGFGPTLGVGSTDKITTASKTAVGAMSWAARFILNGNGGGNFGRIWDRTTGTLLDVAYRNPAVNALDFERGFTTINGIWRTPNNSVAVASSTWRTLVITHDGTSAAPVIYLDGSSVTVSQVTAPSGSIRTGSQAYVIGNRADNARHWDGVKAEFAAWAGVILTAEDAAAYHEGLAPPLIRPTALDTYVQMPNGAAVIDALGSTPSVTGTLAREHPRIIYPRGRSMVVVPSASGGGEQEAASVPAVSTWTAPAQVSAVGAVRAASVPASAGWAVPAHTSTAAGVSASVPAAVAWSVPAQASDVGMVSAASVPAVIAWQVPTHASTTGATSAQAYLFPPSAGASTLVLRLHPADGRARTLQTRLHPTGPNT